MGFKTIIISGMLFFFIPMIASAQNSSSNTIQNTAENVKAKIGTYQFIISANKNTPVFTDEILFEIEKKRDDVEIVYLDLGPGVRVMILPRKTIEAPGFVPLAEVVYN